MKLLAIVINFAFNFCIRGLAAGFSFDGKNSRRANNHMVNVERLAIGIFKGNVVKHLIAVGHQRNQMLCGLSLAIKTKLAVGSLA